MREQHVSSKLFARHCLRLKRAGYEDTAEAKLGLKRTVAMKAVDKHQLLAGFVPAGSFTSTGSLAGFTKDLTNWIGPTVPSEALVVVLIGFPDLESDDDGGDGDDDDDFPYASCDVKDGMANSNQACLNGTVEIFSWPVCDGNSGRVYPTDAGTITVGEGYLQDGVNANYAGTCMERDPETRSPPCKSPVGATNYARRIPYTMNNVVVVTSTCNTYTYRETQPVPGWSYPIWPYEQVAYGVNQGWRHRICCTPK